jgi:hypothetical protein
VAKRPCFVDFITYREVIKSQILGLFHSVPPKNIDFFDFITSLTHGMIGLSAGHEWHGGSGIGVQQDRRQVVSKNITVAATTQNGARAAKFLAVRTEN